MREDKVWSLKAGDVVFKEGDDGATMYVLVSGKIELRKDVDGGETTLKVVATPGEFFGEMALIDGLPRSASAIAAEDSRILMVDERAFEQMIETNGAFALKVIKALSARIRHANVRISELTETDPTERFCYGLTDYALKHGERIHDDSFKVGFEGAVDWANTHLGFTRDDADELLHKLIRGGNIRKGIATSAGDETLLVPNVFLTTYNRRGFRDSDA
jgi:CRP-like cAMP-binding protein